MVGKGRFLAHFVFEAQGLTINNNKPGFVVVNKQKKIKVLAIADKFASLPVLA